MSMTGNCGRHSCRYTPYGENSCGSPIGKRPLPGTLGIPDASVTIHYPVTLNRVIGLLFAVVWGGFLSAVAVGKIVLQFGGTGYVRYMTNWSWTAQAVYFDLFSVFTLLSMIREMTARNEHRAPATDFGLRVVYEVVYLPVQMAVTGVFFGLVVVLYYAPELLSENFATVGEGLTYGGNTVVHYLPPIMYAFHTASIADDLRHIFAKSLAGLVWCILQACLIGTAFAAVYCGAFSPGSVYNLPDVAVTLATATAFVGTALLSAIFTVITFSPLGTVPLVHPTPANEWGKEKYTHV